MGSLSVPTSSVTQGGTGGQFCSPTEVAWGISCGREVLAEDIFDISPFSWLQAPSWDISRGGAATASLGIPHRERFIPKIQNPF